MSETTETPRKRRPQWWDHTWVRHPMDDDQFKDAFFEYMLCRSDDRSLVAMRRRARFLIDYICKQQIEESLVLYRKEHRID